MRAVEVEIELGGSHVHWAGAVRSRPRQVPFMDSNRSGVPGYLEALTE